MADVSLLPEWRVKITSADVTATVPALAQTVGYLPFDFEVYSFGGLRWASYWFESEEAAVTVAALVTLAGWRAETQAFLLAAP